MDNMRIDSVGNEMQYEDRRTVSATMLDSVSDDIGRAGMMRMVEQELIASVLEAARMNGHQVDIPTVTWTCVVVGRERQQVGGGKSQVPGG